MLKVVSDDGLEVNLNENYCISKTDPDALELLKLCKEKCEYRNLYDGRTPEQCLYGDTTYAFIDINFKNPYFIGQGCNQSVRSLVKAKYIIELLKMEKMIKPVEVYNFFKRLFPENIVQVKDGSICVGDIYYIKSYNIMEGCYPELNYNDGDLVMYDNKEYTFRSNKRNYMIVNPYDFVTLETSNIEELEKIGVKQKEKLQD